MTRSLAAELAAISSFPKRGVCRIRTLGEEMSPDDYAAFLNAIDDRKKTAPAIVQVMTAHGFDVTERVIQRHRRGICSCR